MEKELKISINEQNHVVWEIPQELNRDQMVLFYGALFMVQDAIETMIEKQAEE